ncbi:MAG: GTPase Era [bacterium]|nr:GTPase Era [bacterium]
MRSGFVTLAGRSNVGKSTLLNALCGTKAAITSPLPQTTRTPIRGIINDPRGQAVVIDAPGIFESAHGPLTRQVNAAARDALHGVDLILYVVDPTRDVGTEEHRIATLIRATGVPVVLVVNKADLPSHKRKWRHQYLDIIPNVVGVHDVSAGKNQHLTPLVDAIFAHLPEGEAHYPTTQRADVPKDFWIAEIIREKIFLTMTDEIPYTTAVRVDDIAERENGTLAIAARILTTNPRYRKMLIGSGATRIKQIGQMARKDLEIALSRPIYLELHVHVDEKWVQR